MFPAMDDDAFDRALIAAAFELAGERGWARLGIADAARRADLPLDRARARFPGRGTLLRRFGRMADRAALAGAVNEGSARDRLFDLLMRRVDVMQAHRAGVLALMRALPTDPPLAAMLGLSHLCSMRWMLDAAGIGSTGPFGRLRVKGLLGVWLWTLRAWQRDGSEDLGATMAALDQALSRVGRFETWLHPPPPAPPAETPV